MNCYKEIGGFFSIEANLYKNDYHHDGIKLNSARNAFRYILRALAIKKIAVPNYTCPVVIEAAVSEGCELIRYDVGLDFLPSIEFDEDVNVLYTNYFGVNGHNVDMLLQKYRNLIIDNSQSFYSKPKGIASFYSPRKFFGLPDGGIAYCHKKLGEELQKDISYTRCSHLLKRVDIGAENAYDDFRKNDRDLDDKPILTMSLLTDLLMSNIDFESIKKRRLSNFKFLSESLDQKYQLADDDVPMVFPYVCNMNNRNLREKLIQNKIYVARYWPNVDSALVDIIIPLPIDQRYDIYDMSKIVNIIKNEM